MAKLMPQLQPGIIASCGSLCLGTIIGWSSPAQISVMDGHLGYAVSEEQFGWIGSLMVLGAASTCIPVGFIMNSIGRKLTMILFCLPGICGWVLIIMGYNIYFAYCGRFLLGIGGGSFCVTAPLYTTEIAELRVRGTFGTLYQLLITVGIAISYIVGAFCDVRVLSICCCGLFVVLMIALCVIPESPVFYIKKGKIEKASLTLKKLRGSNVDVSHELRDMQFSNLIAKEQKNELLQALCEKPTMKAFGVCIGLAAFQQFGGINSIVFYATRTFQAGQPDLEAQYITIFIGLINCLSTFVSVLIIDRTGRKVLLITSGVFTSISITAFGVLFYLKQENVRITALLWLEIFCVVVYIVGFALGAGPIPWLMLGELFTETVKSLASSICATLNWIFAFVVTLSYAPITSWIGTGQTFWIFGVINFLLILFAIFFLPETKGRTFLEIQTTLGAEPDEW